MHCKGRKMSSAEQYEKIWNITKMFLWDITYNIRTVSKCMLLTGQEIRFNMPIKSNIPPRKKKSTTVFKQWKLAGKFTIRIIHTDASGISVSTKTEHLVLLIAPPPQWFVREDIGIIVQYAKNVTHPILYRTDVT